MSRSGISSPDQFLVCIIQIQIESMIYIALLFKIVSLLSLQDRWQKLRERASERETILNFVYKTQVSDIHCVSKKGNVPTFKLSITLSNLNRFSHFFTTGKPMKFARRNLHSANILKIGWDLTKLQRVWRWELFETQCIQIEEMVPDSSVLLDRRIAEAAFTEIRCCSSFDVINSCSR